MITIAIASCLNKPERAEYLNVCLDSIERWIRPIFPNLEIIIGFDKFGTEISSARCYTHNHGMGHSWNWAIKNAKFDYILQTEDDWAFIPTQNIPDHQTLKNILLGALSIIELNDGLFRLDNTEDWANSFYVHGSKKENTRNFDYRSLVRPLVEPRWGLCWDMYYYNNHPHIKKQNLHSRIGWFKEDAPPPDTEIAMCKLYYNSEQPVFFSDFPAFHHIGMASARSKE